MKLKLLIGLSVFLLTGAVQAKVVSIVDWDGGYSNFVNDSTPEETSCAKACPSYDLITSICGNDEVLESCPADGCSYYHRCVKK